MKKICLIGLIILIVGLWSNLGFAGNYKPGSEPDGFRGIKWGTDISTLADMKYLRTEPDFGGIRIYIRKYEDLRIGGAKLERIEYGFWRGKFWDVYVITQGPINWTGLREAVFEKFGKDYQSNKDIEKYYRFGEITGMILEYNKVSEMGDLWMFSGEIGNQLEAYGRQKAKEGAETGF